MAQKQALSGFKAVSIATNLPGPVATQRLAEFGLSITKVEPPMGDALSMAAGAWYADICGSCERVVSLDLRTDEGRLELDGLLRDADLLITSHRPTALTRLRIGTEELAQVNDQLCWLEIVGDVEAPEVPGHDLTYQAEVGLLDGLQMPKTLIADMAGSQDVVSECLALLLGRERGSSERHVRVGLRQAAMRFALPLEHKLTGANGPLSGIIPQYAVHQLDDGYVACAAIEPHFAKRFGEVVGGDAGAFFRGLTIREVELLAKENDLPLHCFE